MESAVWPPRWLRIGAAGRLCSLRWVVAVALVVAGVVVAGVVIAAGQDARAQTNGEAPSPSAQTAPSPQATPPAPEPVPDVDFSKPMGPADPFNRGTPRGSMYGYLTAARKGDYERAAEYLDLRRLPIGERDRGPELARRLKVVLDQTFWVDLINLSDTNAGLDEDGLPEWQDRFGEIETADGHVALLMQRVPRAGDSVRIWKVSAVTVDLVPDLFAQFEPIWLEDWLPPFFFEVAWAEVPLWKWAGLTVLFLAAWLGALLIAGSSTRLFGIFFGKRHVGLDDRIVSHLRGPVRLAWTVILFMLGQKFLGLALSFTETLRYIERFLLVVAAAWLIFRLIDFAALALRIRAERRENEGLLPALIPGARFAKMMVVAFGGLAILAALGVNVTAAMAGLGVGGIAIALAAQKTLENLFGGLSLFIDRPVHVGDFFRYGTDMGTVEEIGLRSTRIRTLERTVVTIPNGEFSNLRLENFETRERMRLAAIIGVRYETTSEQLRYLLARMREVLIAHPRVLPDGHRVRFDGFGAYSLDIQVVAYVDTNDWNDFLAVREDINLILMDVVKEAGTGFAFPSSTTYIGQDDGLSAEAVRRAEERVTEWRAAGKLPFPDVSEEKYREIENSLEWPPRGAPADARSSGRGKGGSSSDGDG